jgi:23S rRNA (uracil1939-C5)-methyltransferase
LEERFANLTLHIYPTTFFQIHTEQAERLLRVILDELKLQGTETVVDAYCGIGTLTLPIAQRAQYCLGLEVQTEAVEIAIENAKLNGIRKCPFRSRYRGQTLARGNSLFARPTPDIVVLDPPRKGCSDRVLRWSLISTSPAHCLYELQSRHPGPRSQAATRRGRLSAATGASG